MKRPFRRAGADTYKMPGLDSPRAKAGAAMHLANARSIDDWTAERFAHAKRLKLPTAARMLEDERRRRARLPGEPAPCPRCDGKAVLWRFTIDDRRYPVKCPDCGERGIAP